MANFPYRTVALCMAAALQSNAYADEDNTTKAQEDVEVIEVQGVRQTDLKARELERLKKGLSSIIASDDLGNFVDQNVAESLRRLPGVTLQRSEGEGKFVSVRGLGPGFVSVNINGSEASGSGDERKIGLDALPADMLGTIEVLKTLTADQDLNSIGGTVNVKTISAFDRGKTSAKIKVQDSYSDLRGEHSPKISFDATQFLFDKTVGIGFAVSHEERKTQVDEDRHHSTGEMKFLTQDADVDPNLTAEEKKAELASRPEILTPRQLEVRRELAGRKRSAASLNLEFKPSVENLFYFRGNYTRFTDDDVALREFFDFQDAGSVGSGEIAAVNPNNFEFALTDIDVFHQYFIQESETVRTSFSVGGENLIADTFNIAYEYAESKSEDESLGDRRVQFRERDLVVYGRGSRDEIVGYPITPDKAAELGGYAYTDGMYGTSASGDATDLNNFEFDNLFLEGGTRTDDIKTGKLDVTAWLDLDFLSYIKVGAMVTERVHARDKNRWSFDPSAEDCNGNEACITAVNSTHADYASSIPENSNFLFPFVSQQTVEDIVNATRQTAAVATNGEVSIDSTKDDYTITEDTKAVYVMAEIPINIDMTLTTGVRYVETDFSSTGFLSLENDDFEFNGAGGGNLDIAVPLPDSSINYSEFYPSAHLRWEPTDELLVRAAVWTSFTRPSFKQARGFAKFDSDIELCPPQSADCDDAQGSATLSQLQDYILGSNNLLDVGNPNLVAMTSINYDLSLSYYFDENLFLEAALFYKDIDNFIVDVSGVSRSLDELPLSLPVSQVTSFVIPHDLTLNQVNITLNGEKAKVFGGEFSFNKYFENGLFVQSNFTVLESEAQLDPTIRLDPVPLPDQADLTANLSFGWENDDISARIIANYRSEILEEVGSCPEGVNVNDYTECKLWADRYQDELSTVDFKFKYQINGALSVYFDAINLTENQDLRYFEGNEKSGGNIMYQKENYGRTFQLGVTYKLY